MILLQVICMAFIGKQGRFEKRVFFLNELPFLVFYHFSYVCNRRVGGVRVFGVTNKIIRHKTVIDLEKSNSL